MIEEIKELYSQVDKKTQFIIKVASTLGKSPQSLRVHWFAQFWSIPEEHQNDVKDILLETLESQKTPA